MRLAVARMTNKTGEVLLVRKAGTSAFMQPGGKLQEGEDPVAALLRELKEELDMTVTPESLRYLGEAEALAANEPGVQLSASVFALMWDGEVEAHSEIAETMWVDPCHTKGVELAPLTRDSILPWAVQ